MEKLKTTLETRVEDTRVRYVKKVEIFLEKSHQKAVDLINEKMKILFNGKSVVSPDVLKNQTDIWLKELVTVNLHSKRVEKMSDLKLHSNVLKLFPPFLV